MLTSGIAGRVAGGLRSTGRNRGGRGRGRRERAEREKKTTLLIGFFFSKFSIDTQKVLNTKVIPNFEPYHFCFRLIFIWGSVQKLNLKSRRMYVISRFEFEFKFPSTFVWKLKNIWTWKLFHIENATTLVLGKISFELYLRNYFQNRLVWNLKDSLNLWKLRFKWPVILCSKLYFLSLTSTRLWFNMTLMRRLFNFICILALD